MSNITSKLVCLALAAMIIGHATAQQKKDKLDQYFAALAANGRFSGNVLIAENGKTVYERSFGYADLVTKRPNTSQSSFPIASITKTITSTAIMQLKEKGKLQISDPVAKYLPEFPYPDVTIRHLLSHTSGLPGYDKLFLALVKQYPDTVVTNKDIIPAAAAARLPLDFKPGDAFAYNNLNFNVLALIVEKVSGEPFGVYLREHIFRPAGMEHASLSEFFKRKDAHLSKLYRSRYSWSPAMEQADTVTEFRRAMRNYGFTGHGDIICTAHDLLKYDEALYNGRLLSAATLQEAFRPVKLANGNDNPQHYSLGWVTSQDTLLGGAVLHDGGLPGGRSMLWRNTGKRQTVILFDNNAHNLYGYTNDALKILNGFPVPTPGKSGARHYAIALVNKGAAAANSELAQMRKEPSTVYTLDENELNTLGYEFMANNMDKEAYEVFKANMELFPKSWNVYDSYGEILLKMGQKDEAVRMYQKSVELNGGNDNGKKVLAQILAQERPRYKPEPYVPDSRELYDEIVKMDSIFLTAYNNCDLETMRSMFSDSLEFYHDKGGLSTSKKEMMDALRNNICDKVTRELMPGSIEVYPIPNYGAVEIGYHRFHNLVEKSISRPGKFVTIWQKKGDKWQMSRVISLH